MGSVSDILNPLLGSFSLSRALSALATLLVCLVAVKLIMKLVTRLTARSRHINERLRKLIHTGIRAVLYILTAIITAEALGFNTTSLTALLSVLTLGVTLAAEDILGNVAGGLVILSSHPFAPGDFIEADGASGTVREISLNHTKLETADGQIVLLPNKELSSSRIVNYTTLGRRRIVRTVSAPRSVSTEMARAVCMEAVRATPHLLEDPSPVVRLTDYSGEAVVYTVYCWAGLEHYWDACFALNEQLRESFAAHGIEMTRDYVNVHISNQ